MLDDHERRAFEQFLHALEEQQFDPRLQVDEAHLLRAPDGQIIVPVVLDARERSVSLALFMEHKAEHLYRQTGCRFILAQRLQQDESLQYSIWAGGKWKALH